MIASMHLVRYRRRVLRPAKDLAGRIRGLRYWRPLNIGRDFAWFREHPARRHLYPRLRPDFCRWAYFGVWDDQAAYDAFTADPPPTWADGREESLTMGLRPIAAHGTWAGTQALGLSRRAAPAAGAVAHLVRLDLSLRGTLAMWGSAVPGVLHCLPDRADMLLGIPLVDRPYSHPMSFTVWSSADAVSRFAHHGQGHRTAVARVQHSQPDLAACYSTAEFEPFQWQGTWQGLSFPASVLDLSP
jgi:hypothetical protein